MKNLLFPSIVMFLLVISTLSAQQLNSPELAFNSACLSAGFNSFEATYTYSEKSFNADNIFYIELSDAEGSFANATVLKTISDQNNTFSFTTAIGLPETVGGEGYRLRLRSTSPAITGPSSAPFHAWFVPDTDLILNNYETTSVCENSETLIVLNKDIADEYIWYKDYEVYAINSTPELAVNEPGDYFVEPYLGDCTGSLFSNVVQVSAGNALYVSIQSPAALTACSGDTLLLPASVDDPSYIYRWYKGGEQLIDLPDYQPQLEISAGPDTYGIYHLELQNPEGCTAVSQVVSIEPSSPLEVITKSRLESVIIGSNTASLAIEISRSEAQIKWHRDGVHLPEYDNKPVIGVVAPGKYHALVVVTEPCLTEVSSEVFTVHEPTDFQVQVDTASGYKACESSATNLLLTSLRGILTNGDEIQIDASMYHNFSFQWLKDAQVTGQTTSELNLDHFSENGLYELQVGYKESLFVSNGIDLLLGTGEVSLLQTRALNCNHDAMLEATQAEGAIYSWYYNGDLIETTATNSLTAAEEGAYSVSIQIPGCERLSETISIKKELPQGIDVYPGEHITLAADASVEAMASGGDSYLWKDADGNILSETSLLTIKEPGIYNLEITLGECVVDKTVTVEENLVTSIPNIISPNSDSINDRWVLPQKFVDDPEVEVVIYDAYGSLVLKTNQYENNWPESSLSHDVDTPIYYYFLNKQGKNIKKGSITLVN
ncbi:gliding motility-associated C-terminal domain-containing protein [Robertkochia aurantiaca]|uniref:T9SS type B sorting domain-containing protein n=1 Tax=Robertkochia aurantiaca TaxID=2873700 RepID=UPI001CCEF028|nr:gliding motility-associated C-terminal domain-containing protein [Robertkochia sp. 3YJGBD-33]